MVQNDAEIADNAKTVQTPQAYDKRPLAAAFQMTDAMKKELFREMNQYASMASFSY